MTAQNDATVFDFGDRTILQLRNQPFALAESEQKYGTVMLENVSFLAETIVTAPASNVPPPAPVLVEAPFPVEEPTLEQKLDTAIRMIAAMQQRLDSLDATLARVLTR